MAGVREFDTGATRDLDDNKLDFEGFLHPEVEEAFAEYMHRHRQTAAGLRDSDNWQKGIPVSAYLKSLLRHVWTVWIAHRRGLRLPLEELCAIKFNTNGLILETLRKQGRFDGCLEEPVKAVRASHPSARSLHETFDAKATAELK